MKGMGMLVVNAQGCRFRILVLIRMTCEKCQMLYDMKVSFRVVCEGM